MPHIKLDLFPVFVGGPSGLRLVAMQTSALEVTGLRRTGIESDSSKPEGFSRPMACYFSRGKILHAA